MQNSRKKGFSLVELLVAMAIIAVLISIAAFGIQILQRNSRDTQRREYVKDLILLYNDIIANSTANPNILCVSGQNLNFGTGNCTTLLGAQSVPVSSTFTINPTTNIQATCTFTTAETTKNEVTLCFNTGAREIGVNIEGSATPFVMTY